MDKEWDIETHNERERLNWVNKFIKNILNRKETKIRQGVKDRQTETQ